MDGHIAMNEMNIISPDRHKFYQIYNVNRVDIMTMEPIMFKVGSCSSMMLNNPVLECNCIIDDAYTRNIVFQ